jgi:DNA-binding transcriptional MerR regulator
MSTTNNKISSDTDNCTLLKLGEFAELAHIHKDTLIFYIKKGLIKPAYIGQNKYKYFKPEQVQTINTIKYLRRCRIPLVKIKKIMSSPSPETMKKYLDGQIDELNRQLDELKKTSDFVSEIKKELREKNDDEVLQISDFAPFLKK